MTTLHLSKATRIEGNAHIHIEMEGGRVTAARFMVQEFRGFEKFLRGRQVEYAPQIVSRVCGLCSVAHQVASLKALEQALDIETPPQVELLRQVMVLGEWISSHALSYFFLALPDVLGASGGVFQLTQSHPEVMNQAFALRQAGLDMVEILGKRPAHPISLGLGRFLAPPTHQDLERVGELARQVLERSRRLIEGLSAETSTGGRIPFPGDLPLNFLAHNGFGGQGTCQVFDRQGNMSLEFAPQDMEQHVAEMRAQWTLAKFPYLVGKGFPAGIMLVGPLSRSYLPGGFLDDPEVARFDLSQPLLQRGKMTLEQYDPCRLLEIFWAAKQILGILQQVDLGSPMPAPSLGGSGQGFGVVEAPRGLLTHSYLVQNGCVERVRLMVATQINNPYINLLIKDLAHSHQEGEGLSALGEYLIGRCVRLFDPCLSCATH